MKRAAEREGLDAIFREGAGRQWDPTVVDAFFSVRDQVSEASRDAAFDAIPLEVRRTAAIIAALVQKLTPSAVLAVLGYAHLMDRGDRS